VKKMNKKTLSDWLNLLDGSFNDGEIIELPVLSGSMMPLIIPGKNIKIKCMKEPDLNIGDIVVYKEGREITSHRLIAKLTFYKGAYLYQKGDAIRFGGWIKKQQVLGVVDSVQDSSGNYISLMSPDKKREGRELAAKQLLRIFLDLLLIMPRKIKRWLLG
jgi:hypothetical protein